MTVEARIRVHHRGCVSERTGGGTTITQLSGDGPSSLFLVTGGTPEATDEILADVQSALEGPTVLCRSPQVVLVRGACPPSGVEDTIFSYGCAILWPVLFAEGREVLTVLAPSRQRLRELLDRLGEFGSATLESLTDVEAGDMDMSVNIGGLAGNLTTRQLDALLAAVRAGYYESPKRVSAEALARRAGLARSTFEEHLRKAEAKVVTSTAGALANHPLVAASPPPPAEPAR